VTPALTHFKALELISIKQAKNRDCGRGAAVELRLTTPDPQIAVLNRRGSDQLLLCAMEARQENASERLRVGRNIRWTVDLRTNHEALLKVPIDWSIHPFIHNENDGKIVHESTHAPQQLCPVFNAAT
jgi:hypothetical protein